MWKAKFFGTISGSDYGILCRVVARVVAVLAVMVGGFWMRCYGWRVRAVAGVIYRTGSARIRPPSGAIIAGSSKG